MFIAKNTLKACCKTGILAALVAATLSACSPRVSTHGNYPRPEQLELFTLGETNKRTVFEILGPPTTVGTFDRETWYYMTQRFERFAFFEPEMTDLRVIAFYFDERGVYAQHQEYTQDDLRDIAMKEEITPTAGEEISFMQQMFGNFGKIQ